MTMKTSSPGVVTLLTVHIAVPMHMVVRQNSHVRLSLLRITAVAANDAVVSVSKRKGR
jgi:hypothetical protein